MYYNKNIQIKDCEQNAICDYVKNIYYNLLIRIIKSDEFKKLFFKYKNKQKELYIINDKNIFQKIINNFKNKDNNKDKIKKINIYYCKLLKYIDQNLIYNIINEIEPIICINNEVRTKYLQLLKNLICNKKFYKLYTKYSKCPNEDNEIKLINFINGNIRCLKIDCSKCLEKYLPKTIALLELTGGLKVNDNIIKKTLEYYWNNYPNEFKIFPIVDTKGDIEITIQYLEFFYNLGYRYFFACSRSAVIDETLEWFNNHPEAIGFSSISFNTELEIPKRVFRMSPVFTKVLSAISEELTNANAIYYLYTLGELGPESVKKYLEELLAKGEINQLYTYGVTPENLTVDNINNFFQSTNISDNDIVLFTLVDRNSYIDLYNKGLTCPAQQYDFVVFQPAIITGEAAIQLNNKYNSILFAGTNTSILWRSGFESLGVNNYSVITLNVLNMLNSYVTKQNIENINSHFGVLQFDPVTKDIIYPSFLVLKFKDNKFNKQFISAEDPFLGKYQALFVSENVLVKPIISNTLPNGKVIALLELTNSPSDIDIILNDSIYFYWYNDLNLPRFPIINSESSISKTIELLDKYYAEGYRIFLGFSRSTVIKGVIDWFKQHPDATGISVVSRASNLNFEKNIYRLDYPQNLVIETLIPIFEQTPTLYYIYTEGELVALDYLEILSKDPNINLKTLAIKKDSSNLTVDVISTFLSGSTSQDTILLVLFFNQQQYFDLYNQGLFFGGKQYYIIGSLPKITDTAQDILNNNLINIQSVFPNTSLLWRKNTDYLTVKYKKPQSSYGLINGIKMIQYILNNKSISLLGSHLGVLEFNKNNDLKYQSFLTLIYKKDVDTFVKNQIQFNDPFLGYFIADFV
jgi:hypothetical protein